MHPKVGRFCFHEDEYFIIQFESGKCSDSVECFLC